MDQGQWAVDPLKWPRLRGNTRVTVIFDSTDQTRTKASDLAGGDVTIRELSDSLIEMTTHGWLTALDEPWTFRASIPKLVPPEAWALGVAR